MKYFWLFLVVFGCNLFCRTTYGSQNNGCIVPSIPFGKAVQTDGALLEVGQLYVDYYPVKVQCDLSYAIILVSDADNNIKCRFDKSWDKIFPTCQSK